MLRYKAVPKQYTEPTPMKTQVHLLYVDDTNSLQLYPPDLKQSHTLNDEHVLVAIVSKTVMQ
jgi:hypothetical protein